MKKSLAKVFTSLFITTTILSCVAFADTAPVLQLTLEEAQTRALSNSVKYRLQDSYISEAGDDYDEVIESNNRSAKYASQGFLAYFNSFINPDVAVESAGNKIKQERLEKADIKRMTNYDVKNAFIDIKKAQYSLENSNSDISIKLKDYEIAKLNHELGRITTDELKIPEKAYIDAISTKTTLQNKLNEEIQTLNRLIGREITDYNIEPIITLALIDINSIDLDKVREGYIKNDQRLNVLELTVDTAKRKYDLTKEQYEKFVEKLKVQNSRIDMQKAYDNATRDYENSRSSFEDATKDLDISLASTYNTLKDTDTAIKNLIRDIEDSKSDLKILKLKYDNGLLSRIDYEKSEINQKTLQNKLNSLIADMNKIYAGLMLYVE